jgi:hypothetical protein
MSVNFRRGLVVVGVAVAVAFIVGTLEAGVRVRTHQS